MSTTTSRSVPYHEPLPFETLITLPYRDVVVRAAAVVGVTICDLPLSLRLTALPETLALTRTVIELLLARLDLIESTCYACAGTDRALSCAQEIGALEARLGTVKSQVRYALAWRLARPVAI